MILTEYIAKLHALEVEGHGSVEVVDEDDDSVGDPEYNDDDGAAIVICRRA